MVTNPYDTYGEKPYQAPKEEPIRQGFSSATEGFSSAGVGSPSQAESKGYYKPSSSRKKKSKKSEIIKETPPPTPEQTEIKVQQEVKSLQSKGYDTRNVAFDEQGRGYSIDPNIIKRQQELAKTKDTTFYDERGQGFSQDPERVVTEVKQSSPYSPLEVTYASGKKEKYYESSPYGTGYTPSIENFPKYDYTKQTISNKPLTMEEIKLNAKNIDLGQEAKASLKKGGVIGVSGGLALGTLYAGTEFGREFVRTPIYATEFFTGYSFATKKQGIPIVTPSIEMVKSFKYLPQSFAYDPFGTAGRLTGQIAGFKVLGKVSERAGVNQAFTEAYSQVKRTGFNFKSIPTLKDFYNVRYAQESRLGLEFEGFKSYVQPIDISKAPVTDLVLYNRIYVRPKSSSYKGFSEYKNNINVPKGVNIQFSDFSISKPVTPSIFRGRAKLSSQYREPLMITKDKSFVDIEAYYQEYLRGSYKPKVSEGIPKSRVLQPARPPREMVYVPKYDDLGNLKYYKRSSPFSDVSVQIPLKDYLKNIRRTKSLRTSKTFDFSKVSEGRKLYLKRNVQIYSRSKALRRNKELRSEQFFGLSQDFKPIKINVKDFAILKKSKAIRRTKELRSKPLQELPTSALFPFAESPKPRGSAFIKFVEPKKPITSRPIKQPEYLSKSGQVTILKPPKVKEKSKVTLKRKTRTIAEGKPIYSSTSVAPYYEPPNYPSSSSGKAFDFSKGEYVNIQNFVFPSLKTDSPILLSVQEPIQQQRLNYGSQFKPSTIYKPSNILKNEYKQVNIPKVDTKIKPDTRIVQRQTTKQDYRVRQKISPIQRVEVKQDLKLSQDLKLRQVQKPLQRTRFKLILPKPIIPRYTQRFTEKKTFKIQKVKSVKLNLKPSKRKERLDILPSLRNVFIYEGQTGREAKKPKKTKRIKRIFEAQYYGKDLLGSPIPVFQRQKNRKN